MTASQGSDAYAQMIFDRVARGFTPYLLTFVFKPLPGSPSARADQMRQLVGGAFAFCLTHVARRPLSQSFHDWLPIWILMLDLPVYKRERQCLRAVSINDGQHLQGIAAEPPRRRNSETLVEHIARRIDIYRSRFPSIEKIDAKPITHDVPNVANYTFKCLQRGWTSEDDILILSKTGSEMRLSPQRRGSL